MNLGDHDLSLSNETSTAVTRGVAKAIVHPRHFATSGSPGDVALLILDEPVEFNVGVGPVCLPPSDSNDGGATYDKMLAVAAGWGVTEDGETSNKLRQVRRFEKKIQI